MSGGYSLKQYNARIEDLGFELVKGEGYYYFFGLAVEAPLLMESGIYGAGPYLNGLGSPAEVRRILECRVEAAS